MLFKIVVLVSICLISAQSCCFSQEDAGDNASEPGISQEEAEDIVDIMSRGFKKALEEINMEKALQKSEMEQEISASLDTSIQQWIRSQSSERIKSLNALVKQNWQDLAETPLEYHNYYLRDFSYSAQGKNVIETNSIIYPYEAEADLLELLYVEQAPLIAEPRSRYQYTAVTDIRINLRYKIQQKEWEITDIYILNVALSQGWPSHVKKKLGQYFIPAE